MEKASNNKDLYSIYNIYIMTAGLGHLDGKRNYLHIVRLHKTLKQMLKYNSSFCTETLTVKKTKSEVVLQVKFNQIERSERNRMYNIDRNINQYLS